MDMDMDDAQYQEDNVRNVELSYRKKIIYKCEVCNDNINPKSNIKRWCTDCFEEEKSLHK